MRQSVKSTLDPFELGKQAYMESAEACRDVESLRKFIWKYDAPYDLDPAALTRWYAGFRSGWNRQYDLHMRIRKMQEGIS